MLIIFFSLSFGVIAGYICHGALLTLKPSLLVCHSLPSINFLAGCDIKQGRAKQSQKMCIFPPPPEQSASELANADILGSKITHSLHSFNTLKILVL